MENRNVPTYQSVFGMASGPSADSFVAFVSRFGNSETAKVIRAAAELYRDVVVAYDAQVRDDDIVQNRTGDARMADPNVFLRLRGIMDFVKQFELSLSPVSAQESADSIDTTPKKRKSRIGK